MEEIKRLLPDYAFKMLNARYVLLDKSCIVISFIIRNIDAIKFIHDNIKYFKELISFYGYKLVENYSRLYVNDKVFINFHLDLINISNKETGEIYIYKNPETMYDDLRKFLGVKLLYKPVITLQIEF